MSTDGYLATYVRMFFEDYLICRRRLAIATIHSYRDAIKLFMRFLFARCGKAAASIHVTDINDSVINDFLMDLETQRNNSIQTRNHRLVVLRSLFKYIALQDPVLVATCRQILEFPTKRVGQQAEVVYLEQNELDALFATIDRRTDLGRRDYALLLFMYNTGARASEAADVRPSRLCFEAPYRVQILGKRGKWRTCPLWKSTVVAIQKLLKAQPHPPGPNDHVFRGRTGKPLGRFGIYELISKYKDKAARDLPSLKKKRVTPHTVRHTTAMHLLQAKVDINVIRSWLGHTSLTTTHRYAEIDLVMKSKALQACEVPLDHTSAHWHTSSDILSWLETL